MQEKLGETMYTPAGCGGRRRVRPVGLARGGVTEQGPVAAVILVPITKSRPVNMERRSRLNFRKA